jgi:hypothetical protein
MIVKKNHFLAWQTEATYPQDRSRDEGIGIAARHLNAFTLGRRVRWLWLFKCPDARGRISGQLDGDGDIGRNHSVHPSDHYNQLKQPRQGRTGVRPCAMPGFGTLAKVLQEFLFQIQSLSVFILCILVYEFYENSAVKAFMSSQVGFALRFGHILRS